jgi:rare lipoprotein A
MTKAAVSKELRLSAKRALSLLAGAVLCAGLLSACSGGSSLFPSSKWGAASPRVTTSKNVPKGGGRAMVGRPYQVAGRWYTPRIDRDYDKTGKASWYGDAFHGRLTANGEIFDQNALSAAHPTLPLPSYMRVTNLENRTSLIVRVNDRGPFVRDRLIDLSKKSAQLLGFINKGVARVRVQYVGPAPLEGDDTRILLASINRPSTLENGGATSIAATGTADSNSAGSSSRRSEPVLETLKTLFTNPLDLFAYADDTVSRDPIHAAFAATEAVAASAELGAWRQGVDIDLRRVDIDLGIFSDPARADEVARAFALIAAVEVETVRTEDNEAIRLRLSWLKPGATRADIINLAGNLSLEDIAFDG